MIPARHWVIAAVSFLAVLVPSSILASLDYSWAPWTPASCMPDRCFCERVGDLYITDSVAPVNKRVLRSFDVFHPPHGPALH